ncbi:hypothetical protein MRX96_025255 [Rhipicephalus microplus]
MVPKETLVGAICELSDCPHHIPLPQRKQKTGPQSTEAKYAYKREELVNRKPNSTSPAETVTANGCGDVADDAWKARRLGRYEDPFAGPLVSPFQRRLDSRNTASI